MKKELIYLGASGDFTIDGINPFDCDNIKIRYVREIYVKDPTYNKRHKASVYRILQSGTKYAMAEFSNNIWGIYIIK